MIDHDRHKQFPTITLITLIARSMSVISQQQHHQHSYREDSKNYPLSLDQIMSVCSFISYIL